MAMTTALLTVHGAQQHVDLQVPIEVPIEELVPTLLETLEMASGNRLLDAPTLWGLGRSHAAAPLAPSSTLHQAGIVDGDELVLQAMANWHDARDLPPTAPSSHQSDNNNISVTWHAVENWNIR